MSNPSIRFNHPSTTTKVDPYPSHYLELALTMEPPTRPPPHLPTKPPPSIPSIHQLTKQLPTRPPPLLHTKPTPLLPTRPMPTTPLLMPTVPPMPMELLMHMVLLGQVCHRQPKQPRLVSTMAEQLRPSILPISIWISIQNIINITCSHCHPSGDYYISCRSSTSDGDQDIGLLGTKTVSDISCQRGGCSCG